MTEYLLLDSGSGTLIGEKTGIPFTITGALTVDTSILGKRVSGFAASTNYITTSDTRFLADPTKKLSIHITTTFVQASAYQFLFSQGADNAKANIAIYNTNILYWGLPNTGAYYTSVSAAALAPYCDGREHDLYCLFDPALAKMYQIWIDGVMVSEAGTSALPASVANTIIGVRQDNLLYPWSGKIADYAIALNDEIPIAYRTRKYNNGQLKKYGTGSNFIVRGSVDNLTGSKLTTATKLTRQDTTNQNPVIYQRSAILA